MSILVNKNIYFIDHINMSSLISFGRDGTGRGGRVGFGIWRGLNSLPAIWEKGMRVKEFVQNGQADLHI